MLCQKEHGSLASAVAQEIVRERVSGTNEDVAAGAIEFEIEIRDSDAIAFHARSSLELNRPLVTRRARAAIVDDCLDADAAFLGWRNPQRLDPHFRSTK